MKFSIGIPAFKSRHLKECIESILNQSFQDFELIIVNDASPENIEEIVFTFNSPKIKYFRNKQNSGSENVVENWNKCLAKASGQFFLLMGDDDKLAPGFLEEFVRLIEKYPLLDVYHCRSFIIDENSEFVALTPSWPEFESVYENIWHKRFGQRLQFISDFVFRTSSLKEKGGFFKLPLAWASDDITSFIAMEAKGIAHTNSALLYYRRHSRSISLSGDPILKMRSICLQADWFSGFLAAEPREVVDIVLHKNIQINLSKNIQLQKVQTMKDSYQINVLKYIGVWLRGRSKFDISILEVTYSILAFLKTAVVRRTYGLFL